MLQVRELTAAHTWCLHIPVSPRLVAASFSYLGTLETVGHYWP